MGWATLALADVRLRAGDFSESGRLLCDAARLARQTGDVFDGIEALERMAQWLGRMTSPASAVRCWAAAHAARAKYDFAAEPRETETMEQALKKDRATMGQRGFDETWAAGSALGLAEALELGATSLAAEEIRPGASPSGTHGRPRLTPREHEVLTLLAAGRSDAEIAEALFISKKTASVHVANVKAKVGAESRVEMALIAVRLGLGDSSPEAGGS